MATGYDIGIANSRAIHPNLHPPEEERTPRKRDSYISNRRDAYLAAVRDAFIEPEGDFRSYQAPPPGYWHTYHGPNSRQRPSVLNIDMEAPSASLIDNDLNMHYLGGGAGYKNYNARTTSHRSSYADSDASGVSGSTPTTERTVIFNRQLSSENGVDSIGPTQKPALKPQRRSVTFEDDFIAADYSKTTNSNMYHTHRRTPSNTSNSSIGYDQQDPRYPYSTSQRSTHTPNTSISPHQQPVPPRRRPGSAEPAQRPTTLDIGCGTGISGNSRTTPIQLKYPAPSPSHALSNKVRGIPPVSDEQSHYYSSRSHLSPGNTPPHIAHQKTLLDIDVEGQHMDSTAPLVQHNTNR